MCLQNLLVFPFNLDLIVSITLILEEKFVESWRIALC